MSSTATLDHTQPLDDSMGAFFVGLLFSAVLHGLCLMQAFQYFRKYQDPWYIKGAVLSVVSVDFFHLLLVSAGVYHYLITYFHDSAQLEYLTWPLLIEALLVGINASIVQTFYVFRIWRMSKRNVILCGTIALLIVGEVASGMTWVIMTLRMETWRELLTTRPVAITIDIFSCTIDVIIAGSLCFMLHRARTGFKRSDTIINKLMIFIINTGILTTVFAFAAMISVIAAPTKMYYAGFYFCIGRLYTNSFLATLNARSSVSSVVDETEMKASSVTPRGTTSSNLNMNMNANPRNINIRIETTQASGMVEDKENIRMHSIRSKVAHSDDELSDFAESKAKGDL